MSLADKTCKACEGDVPKLGDDEITFLLGDEIPAWRRDGDWIVRERTMRDFMDAVQAVQSIAAIAEGEGHHPDLRIHGYKHLEVRIQTHAVGGLTENDFILAAKIERQWSRDA